MCVLLSTCWLLGLLALTPQHLHYERTPARSSYARQCRQKAVAWYGDFSYP